MTPENTTLFDIQEMADYLLGQIGPTALAFACDSPSTEAVKQWASGDKVPDQESQERLTVCYQTVKEVVDSEGAQIARAWLLSSNCCNMTQSPLEAIRSSNVDEVRASAARMCSSEDMGR